MAEQMATNAEYPGSNELPDVQKNPKRRPAGCRRCSSMSVKLSGFSLYFNDILKDVFETSAVGTEDLVV